MECNRSFTNRCAFTLSETVIVIAIVSLLGVTLAGMFLYSTRTFGQVANYLNFEDQSRIALSRMSRLIRQADQVTFWATNKLTLQTGTNNVSFTYYPAQRRLLWESSGRSEVLLRDCDYVRFDIYQRNLIGGGYDYYPAATPSSCKVVQTTWACSKTIMGQSNTASAVSAKVVIRKQKL